MCLRSASLAVLLSAVAVQKGRADTLTTYADRPTFLGAVGPVTVEDFTSAEHFAISTGTLNSNTNLVVEIGTPIMPGDIKPGVTYASDPNSFTAYAFNIDSGGGFVGGFLDGYNDLTITFDSPASGFGFDTNGLASLAPTVTVNFTNATSTTTQFVVVGTTFIGQASNAADIQSVVISGLPAQPFGFRFAIDNFTFTPGTDAAATPLPGAAVAGMTLLGGLGGFRALGRRRKVAPAIV